MKNQPLIDRLFDMPYCKRELKVLFAQQFLPLSFEKGQTFIGPNLLNQCLYYVTDGLLRRYPLQLGLPKTVQLYISGDFMAQNGAYTKRPNMEYVECLSHVQLMSVSYKQLERFFRQYPEAIKLLLCIMEDQMLKEIETCKLLHLEGAINRYHFASLLLGKYIHELPKPVLASYLRIGTKQLSRLLINLTHQK